jgi:ADP-dependent NAD(P)H-hydrate dehydratase
MSAVEPVDVELLKRMPLPEPGEGTDKDSRGKVLVAGGSAVSAGAVTLSGLAALRAGAGKVLLAVPDFLSVAIAVDFPEAGVHRFSVTDQGHPSSAAAEQIEQLVPKVDAVLLGPGLSDESSAQTLAATILECGTSAAMVIDAMCLTGLWTQPHLTASYGSRLVITPHPGEMAALTGRSKEDINADPVRAAEKAAAHLRCIVVLKGADTVIAQPAGPTFRYAGGGVGLATSGSGDVLAGVLAALIARGARPIEAALWSVFLHGEAGRRLAAQIGPIGYLARELPAQIPGLINQKWWTVQGLNL